VKLSELAKEIGVDCAGDGPEIRGINTLTDARGDELSFFHNAKYARELETTQAAAVLVEERMVPLLPAGTIPLITDEPYVKLALASKHFARPPLRPEGADPILGAGCLLAPNVSLGRDVVIGGNVTLMSGVCIGDNVHIGDGCLLHPNVVVYPDSIIGSRCILQAGAVIGSDGFGFATTREGRHIKIHQLGNVVIGDDVEIGANTTIDRAAFGSTLIKEGCKIDNLVQIGHNSVIGEHAILVSQVGISGSTTLGRNVVMGGQSATIGHLEIGEFAIIYGRGVVTKSLEGRRHYAGFPLVEHQAWLKLQGKIARFFKGK